jgi:hypothetical protein
MARDSPTRCRPTVELCEHMRTRVLQANGPPKQLCTWPTSSTQSMETWTRCSTGMWTWKSVAACGSDGGHCCGCVHVLRQRHAFVCVCSQHLAPTSAHLHGAALDIACVHMSYAVWLAVPCRRAGPPVQSNPARHPVPHPSRRPPSPRPI